MRFNLRKCTGVFHNTGRLKKMQSHLKIIRKKLKIFVLFQIILSKWWKPQKVSAQTCHSQLPSEASFSSLALLFFVSVNGGCARCPGWMLATTLTPLCVLSFQLINKSGQSSSKVLRDPPPLSSSGPSHCPLAQSPSILSGPRPHSYSQHST